MLHFDANPHKNWISGYRVMSDSSVLKIEKQYKKEFDLFLCLYLKNNMRHPTHHVTYVHTSSKSVQCRKQISDRRSHTDQPKFKMPERDNKCAYTALRADE